MQLLFENNLFDFYWTLTCTLTLTYTQISAEEYFKQLTNEIYEQVDPYSDILIFTKARNSQTFTFNEIYDGSDFKIPMFHCNRFDYWYSFVSFDQLKFTHFVKLSIDNFCYWLRAGPYQLNTLKSWQDEYKIVLTHHLVDMEKNARYQLSIRGNLSVYNPSWTPKYKINIGISEENHKFVYLFNYKAKTMCGMPNCRFSTQRKDKLKRHRDNCKDTSVIATKKVCYGLDEQAFDDFDFDDSFINNPNFKFATFDLETTESESINVEAKLKLLSIGLYSNIDEQQYYYERKSSAMEHGQEMVDQFIERLFVLATMFQAGLPPQITDELEKIKEMISTLTCT